MQEHSLTNVKTIFTKLVVILKFFSWNLFDLLCCERNYEVQSHFNTCMKEVSLSDVEQKYSGIVRAVCILGQNYLVNGLIQLASDTISAIGCILR